MRLPQLATLAAISLAMVSPVLAQPSQADVGSFVRDQNGAIIGSLKALHGNEAVVWYGLFRNPGNHLETVPANEISKQGSRLVLNSGAMPVLATR